MQLHKKDALVREGSGYLRNRTYMGVSISVLAHLVMKCMIQFTVKLNLILRVSYDAMQPYGGIGGYWVKID